MAKLTYEFHLIKENGEIIDIDKVPEDVKKKMANLEVTNDNCTI